MRLTDRLRAQHAQLDAMLEAMQRTGAAGAEGRERLQQARQAMLDHLALEQDRLYPALLEHPAAGRLARQYAGEMAQLAPAVIAFFDAYRDGGADALGFARSLGQLLVVLRERVGREEAWLYPVYEVHCERSDG